MPLASGRRRLCGAAKIGRRDGCGLQPMGYAPRLYRQMQPLIRNRLTRRALLRAGLGAAAATLGGGAPVLRREALAAPAGCGGLQSIEHVVILIQENRSFDHYFGTHRGVRGFADPGALRLSDGHSVFEQPDVANTTDAPRGRILPFRLDTSALPPSPNGTCTEDITHAWGAQHDCWNGGAMDGWARVHRAADGPYGTAAMGYYTREDLPFYRAVADAFTLCDGYHCSVLGPTDPNRLMAMTASIDPDGHRGGPVLSNPSSGSFTWTTYPERLEAAGITWKQYSDRELALTNSNVLSLFAAYHDQQSDLYARGVAPAYPDDFLHDVLGGTLPGFRLRHSRRHLDAVAPCHGDARARRGGRVRVWRRAPEPRGRRPAGLPGAVAADAPRAGAGSRAPAERPVRARGAGRRRGGHSHCESRADRRSDPERR
jgi:phosphoesterase family protein